MESLFGGDKANVPWNSGEKTGCWLVLGCKPLPQRYPTGDFLDWVICRRLKTTLVEYFPMIHDSSLGVDQCKVVQPGQPPDP